MFATARLEPPSYLPTRIPTGGSALQGSWHLLAAPRTVRTELLAFLDNDCVAPPVWLERAARLIRKNKGRAKVLGGDDLMPGERVPTESTSVLAMMTAGSYLP